MTDKIDLNKWKTWFERKGYDSELFEGGEGENIDTELIIKVNVGCHVCIDENGNTRVAGNVNVTSKTDLWKLINTLGVIK